MIAEEICSLDRWNGLCSRLGLSNDTNTYFELIEAHAQKHRAYHTLDHIAACLKHLDHVKDQVDRADDIELSLWFHDAIYQPFSATNEEDSADWAVNWLSNHGAQPDLMDRVKVHILATKTHDRPERLDGRYMLDIDLSILGTSPHVYDQFEIDIRREYKRVPKFIFRKKRKAILHGFLSRDYIYATEYFRERFEQQAHINLECAIARL